MEFRAEVYSSRQLESALKCPELKKIYAPMKLIGEELLPEKDRLIAVPPVFLADCEERVFARLSALREQGFYMGLAHTVGHIELLRRAGYQIHGGARLNCANSEALRFFYECGARDVTVSAELTAEKMNRLDKPCPVGFLAYGYLPLMITRRCPIADGKPCGVGKRCGKTLTDRTGRQLDIICSENTAEVLNSEVLYLADRLDRFRGADFAVLKFTVEDDIEPVISAYLDGAKPENTAFTRGLYFRGVE